MAKEPEKPITQFTVDELNRGIFEDLGVSRARDIMHDVDSDGNPIIKIKTPDQSWEEAVVIRDAPKKS